MIDVSKLRKELETGREAKRARISSSWIPNDKAYNGDVPKYSKLPYNFHLPILSGFEDTLIAKIDEAPNIKFGAGQAGEVRLGRMYDALWREQSEQPDCDYSIADLISKRHAARYGRAFHKTYGTKSPFSIKIDAVDPYDMVVDPNGGGDLENHRFCAQDGIFRSKKELLDGAKSGLYDKKSVAKLLAGPNKDSREQYKIESDSTMRWSSLNQSGFAYDASGEDLYRLVEHVTVKDGVRYLVTWNPESSIVVSEKPLKEAYGCDLLPWTSWAPYYDSKVFWSKSPDDDVRGAAESMRLTIMEMLANVQKQNWGTRIFDPERVSAEDLIQMAPNGLIPTKPGTASLPGGLPSSYHVIQTPEITIAANVVEFLDRFTGQKSGVTPDAQGTSSEDKVGIYFGNIEQMADRMGLHSRWYKNCWRQDATRFLHQAKRNLAGKYPVQTIGARGAEMMVLMARNIDPTVGITISGGSAEAAVSEAKRKERAVAIETSLANPLFKDQINVNAALAERLKSAGFEEDEVRLLLNKEAGTEYRDQQLRASESVEKILEGEKVQLYQGATTVFVQSILESAQLYTDSDGPEHERLIAYANAHIPIAAKNAALMASEQTNKEMSRSLQEPMEQEVPQEVPQEPIEAPQEQLITQPETNVQV